MYLQYAIFDVVLSIFGTGLYTFIQNIGTIYIKQVFAPFADIFFLQKSNNILYIFLLLYY